MKGEDLCQTFYLGGGGGSRGQFMVVERYFAVRV